MQRTDTSDTEVVFFQKYIRGKQVRDQFQFNQLANHELADYSTFVVGNDPMMPKELDNYAEPNDKIALVATSGMRAVSLACKLGNSKQLPKIILVDNSQQVTAFWQAMRHFMQDDMKAGTKELFLSNLPAFLFDNQHLYRNLEANAFKDECTDTLKYLSQDISGFFKALTNKYGYDYVRAVIAHAAVIRQSWSDEDTFKKIKNIANYLGINKIFMYPSNIVACIDKKLIRNQVLKNIESVAPVLSIHTDVCFRHHHPERVLLLTNQEPTAVRATLFQSACLNPSLNTQAGNGLSMNDLIYLLASMQQHPSNNNHSFMK